MTQCTLLIPKCLMQRRFTAKLTPRPFVARLAASGGHGNQAVACCAFLRMATVLQVDQLLVLASVGIVVLVKMVWTTAGNAGTKDAAMKVGALHSALMDASGRSPGSGRWAQGRPAV